eukprot:7524195-Prorocentrum_lima.AAC.1
MTSSLVGSEDVYKRQGVSYEAVASSGQQGWANAAKSRAQARAGSGSVSYTHLTLPTICSV